MASFQDKIVWKRPRKRENKNYRFDPFCSYQTRYRKFQKKSKKTKKNKKNTITVPFQAKIVWKMPTK